MAVPIIGTVYTNTGVVLLVLGEGIGLTAGREEVLVRDTGGRRGKPRRLVPTPRRNGDLGGARLLVAAFVRNRHTYGRRGKE